MTFSALCQYIDFVNSLVHSIAKGLEWYRLVLRSAIQHNDRQISSVIFKMATRESSGYFANETASSPGVLVAISIHKACHVITIVLAVSFLTLDLASIWRSNRGTLQPSKTWSVQDAARDFLTKPGQRLRTWQALIALGILGHSTCFAIALFGDFRSDMGITQCWYIMGLVPLICKMT